MKKLCTLVFVLLGLMGFSQEQDIFDNAIGLRLGDSDGFGTEISYQRRLGDSHRLEFNLGWRNGNDYSALRAVGLYQWVNAIDTNFNWYYGAGGGIASYSIDNVPAGSDDNNTSLFVAGDIGIEYNFQIPIIISLDFRPELGFGDFNNDLDFDIAVGIRYQF